jgi:hypothetical protein
MAEFKKGFRHAEFYKERDKSADMGHVSAESRDPREPRMGSSEIN